MTEAEWEYAARAGTTTPFWTGSSIAKDQANFDNPEGTVNVGSFHPNAFGLHDMAGNVSEWVQDCWNKDYLGAPAPADGSAWTIGDCSVRMYRGGHWNRIFSTTSPRSAARSYRLTQLGHQDLGFRVARTPNP